jgi:hypothetical protein
MTVAEPATQQTHPPAALPRQREAAEPVASASASASGAVGVAVDHVCVHGRSCYWDLAECRWRCG